MPNYVVLTRWTDQGVRAVKESPNRLDAFKKSLRGTGVELKDFFLAMGQYDIIMVLSAPNDEALAKVGLAAASLGNIRTETHRIFTEDEYRKLIGSLPSG